MNILLRNTYSRFSRVSKIAMVQQLYSYFNLIYNLLDRNVRASEYFCSGVWISIMLVSIVGFGSFVYITFPAKGNIVIAIYGQCSSR